MVDFAKQDVVNDQYYISTTASADAGKKFVSTVFGYYNKRIMWSKVYKQVYYKDIKEAEEGHKALKKEFS